MTRGAERIERIAAGLHRANLDALICALPTNVLLLSGYWPVVGTAPAIATRDGRVAVLAPEDEQDLAARGWAIDVRLFRPGSLARLTPLADAVRDPLAEMARGLGVEAGRIGYDAGAMDEPASYASINGNALPRLHPASDDVLDVGMVSNVEPAIYVEGYGGVRHCDVVAVGERGAEVLTLFQADIERLMIA